MSNKSNLDAGDIVRNSQTGEVGIVKKVVYYREDIFAVIVKTRTGRQRWVVVKKKTSAYQRMITWIKKRLSS